MITKSMDSGKKVSVIIPTYERESIVGRSIQSVLDQTYKNFELIVVDDGSTDNTKDVVRRFGDERIVYVAHGSNKGLAAARNTGIKRAKGEYLSFCDSDAEWTPEKLERAVTLLSSAAPRVGMAYGIAKRTYYNGKTVFAPPKEYPKKEGDLFDVLLRGDFSISPLTWVIKKECIAKVGLLDESFSVFGDQDFLLRFAEHYEFVFDPDVHAIDPVGADSISRNREKRLLANIKIYKKQEENLDKRPDIKAKYAYSIGHALALRGELQKAGVYLKEASKHKPQELKYRGAHYLAHIGSRSLYKICTYLYVVLTRRNKKV